MPRTKNFDQVVRKLLANDKQLAADVEAESFNANIAMQIYEARIESGLTQKELAKAVGTTQSVISRLEDADYDGHSLGLLKRIALALGKTLTVELFACPLPNAEKRMSHFKTEWAPLKEWHLDIRELRPELDVVDVGGI